MTPGPGVVKPSPGKAVAGGPDRPNRYLMTFVGGNVAEGSGNPGLQNQLAVANLEAAARLELQVPETLGKGESGQVVVRVTNVGAGHFLPTGLTEVRQMWLEVNLVSDDGQETTLGRRDFGTVLKDASGAYPVELWEAVGIQSDDRIPPLGSVTATYAVEMPSDTLASVEAVLYYRSMPEELAKKADVANPVTRMGVARRTIAASAEGDTSGSDPGGTATIALIALGVLVVAGAAAGVVLWMRSRRRSVRP